MLIKLSVENFKSFDKAVEISLITSNKIREKGDHRVTIKQTNLLKNAVIYGANASGKTNLVDAFIFMKNTVQTGLPVDSGKYFCRNSEENKNRNTTFELQFTINDIFYVYGFSAILSQGRITEEWLYELLQSGDSKELFVRENDDQPRLGQKVRPTDDDRKRFSVYAADFSGHEDMLFLSVMGRDKKYGSKSKLIFFKEVYNYFSENLIVLKPDMGIADPKMYYDDKSLEYISKLIHSFDTGVADIKVKNISVDEMKRMVNPNIAENVIMSLKQNLKMANTDEVRSTVRIEDEMFNIAVRRESEPEITTLVLKHSNPVFDFEFCDESDGTKRLFDLVYMLLTKQADTVFIVDELERSLHPKLTRHFLELFMDMHKGDNIQLIFTTHESTIMDQSLFRRDEIWFVERDENGDSRVYSLDRFKERYDKKISKDYLDGRYGAIPVFADFSF